MVEPYEIYVWIVARGRPGAVLTGPPGSATVGVHRQIVMLYAFSGFCATEIKNSCFESNSSESEVNVS
jgi:hypothetical protein